MNDQATAQQDELTLPDLREDIRLLPGPESHDGAPTWAIYDPVRNRYFRINWAAFELLSRWSAASAADLLGRVQNETTCEVGPDDLTGLVRFLYTNNLTLASSADTVKDFSEQYQATRSSPLAWLMKHYLFLRLPLVRPDRHLQKLTPYLAPLFSHWVRNGVLLLGVIGLLLINQQWTAFTNTFLYFFTLEGLGFYFLGLAVVKICHELGHAVTATRFGCRVATMGVAFLVFFPVLYTDTTDAYRLTSRNRRLYISAAGILTEFYLALICIFLWGILPDGVFRSVVFVIGTVSFTLTVLININPFLRFDGYYFLADWLGIENLQARSFALGKWRLREFCFALGEPSPEPFSAGMQRFLVLFAWATWTYRFLLLLAIGLVVYHFFFKLLGVILFLGVLYTFILGPILKELLVWWQRRDSISRFRAGYLVAGLTCLLLVVVIPWRTTITAPAIVAPAVSATIYSPAPARIVSVPIVVGDRVQEGETLVVLESPRLAEELARLRIEISVIEMQLNRVAASTDALEALTVQRQRLQEKRSRVAALNEMAQQLVLRSPIDGTVVELGDALHVGRWINESLPVAFLANEQSLVVKAVLAEQDLARVELAQAARFIPDDGSLHSFVATVTDIDRANLNILDMDYLASVYGGPIAVRRDDQGGLVPEAAIYRLQLAIEVDGRLPDQVVRGVAKIDGTRKSYARRAFEVIAAAAVRGSAF